MAFDARADRGSRGPRLAGLPKFAGPYGYSPTKMQSLQLTDSKELREIR